MWPAGLLGAYATSCRPGTCAPSDRFREQVWPGDTLTCSGELLREYEQDGEHRVDIELTCRRQTGGVAVTVWSTFVRPEEGEDVQ